MTIRQTAKLALPRRLHARVQKPVRFAERLIYWTKVMRGFRGVEESDRRELRRAYLRSPITSLADLEHWQDPVVGADVTVEVPAVGRFRVRSGSDDLHHVSAAREPEVFAAIRDLLHRGDTFVDAGANIGFYSVLAARRVGPEGRVIAVEMMPDTAQILREHFQMNKVANASVVERALCESEGGTLEAHVEKGKFGRASITQGKRGESILVRTTTLNNVLRDAGPVTLMKMDLEGAEHVALNGATEVLSAVGAIIFEAWSRDTTVAQYLQSRGYKISRLSSRDWLAKRP